MNYNKKFIQLLFMYFGTLLGVTIFLAFIMPAMMATDNPIVIVLSQGIFAAIVIVLAYRVLFKE